MALTARQAFDIARAVVRPTAERVRMTVARGVVALVNDALKCQALQVTLLADEVQDGVERFQEYGFTSVPFTGAEVVYLSVGGNRGHGIVVAVADRRHRPTGLAEGDVAMHTDKGVRVKVDRAADLVELGNAPSDYVALAPATKGELEAVRDSLADLVTAFNAHVHPTAATGAPSPPTPVPGQIPAMSPAAVGEVAATEVKAK